MEKKDLKLTSRQTYTYDLDSLGSVIALKNAKGEVVNRYSYDVWGDLISSEEQVPNAIRYRGEYQDDETGFYYLKGRYYDPATRQFTTSDLAEDGLNWNMYCEGNPVNYADPSGYVRVVLKPQKVTERGKLEEKTIIYYADRHLAEIMNVIRPAGVATIAAETIAGWITEIARVTQIYETIKNTSDIALGKIARQQRDADLLEACKVAVSSIHPVTRQMMGGVKLELYSDADGIESDNYALRMPEDW